MLCRPPPTSCFLVAVYGSVAFHTSISLFRALRCSFARPIFVQQPANSPPSNVSFPLQFSVAPESRHSPKVPLTTQSIPATLRLPLHLEIQERLWIHVVHAFEGIIRIRHDQVRDLKSTRLNS